MILQDTLKKWFKQQARELPWRQELSAYRVWISEVMLQQTQALVVKPYFETWMATFPDIKSLAAAPLEKVLKLWEGLGYYSRARHLHAGARYLVQHFGGELTLEALDHLKGIGPYTKGAILNFAFHQKAVAIDGNVVRVLTRLWGIDTAIERASTKKELNDRLKALLPEEEPWIFSEALIELGAMVCKKTKPQCEACPLRQACLAYRHGRTDQIPVKGKTIKTTFLTRHVAVVVCGEYMLIKKGEKGRVMADLYEFPYDEGKENLLAELELPLTPMQELPMQKHTFTRYHVTLLPVLYQAPHLTESEGWHHRNQIKHLPFSSGHRLVLKSAFNALNW